MVHSRTKAGGDQSGGTAQGSARSVYEMLKRKHDSSLADELYKTPQRNQAAFEHTSKLTFPPTNDSSREESIGLRETSKPPSASAIHGTSPSLDNISAC